MAQGGLGQGLEVGGLTGVKRSACKPATVLESRSRRELKMVPNEDKLGKCAASKIGIKETNKAGSEHQTTKNVS